MDNKRKISTGDILIAEPFMMDTNFKRAVICICEHSLQDGTVGYIINKPMNISLNELVVDIKSEEKFKVYYGGPVAPDTIHYIHNVGELLEGSVKISRGVYWGGDFDKLKFLIQSELIKPSNIKFYLGYSGWSGGQLEDELTIGSWIISEIDSNYIFKLRPSVIWKETMSNKGNTFSVIAQIPHIINFN
jgi:putative transcriptional regulator